MSRGIAINAEARLNIGFFAYKMKVCVLNQLLKRRSRVALFDFQVLQLVLPVDMLPHGLL